MTWSLKKKKPDADVILPPSEGKGLFRRGAKQALAAAAADAETVEVVTVWNASEYPPASAELDGADAISRVEPKLGDTPVVAPEVPAAATPEQPVHVEPTKEAKKPLWAKGSKKEKEPKLAKPPKAKTDKSPAGAPRPLKVLIGYLPDSSERDTYYYMLGVAEKNLDSENIGYAGLTKFETGYAYEIHEGGNGRGFLDSILSHFKQLPAFSAEETHHAFIRTATRTVRVERTSAGIYSVILPESDTTPQSDWVVSGKKLAPLVEKRTGLFVAGVVIFLSSIVALMGGYATRYQPYTATVVNIERVPVAKLPYSQWNTLTNLQPGDYVMALRYDRGEWLVQTPSNPSGRAGGPPRPGAARTSPRRAMPAATGAQAPAKPASVTATATSAAAPAPARVGAPVKPDTTRKQ